MPQLFRNNGTLSDPGLGLNDPEGNLSNVGSGTTILANKGGGFFSYAAFSDDPLDAGSGGSFQFCFPFLPCQPPCPIQTAGTGSLCGPSYNGLHELYMLLVGNDINTLTAPQFDPAHLLAKGLALIDLGATATLLIPGEGTLAKAASEAASQAAIRAAEGTIAGDIGDEVYRVIRWDEDPASGLTAKDISASKTVESHVGHGSAPGYKSQIISATRSLPLALRWAQEYNMRIVGIDLSKVQSRVIDLSTQEAARMHIQFPMTRNFAVASREVLIERYAPPDALRLVYPSAQ